jgi:LysM repeat protein
MKKLKLPLTICFILLSKLIFAQNSDRVKQYIETYKDIAIEEMQRTGVPAAITLAQGIHETEAGTSDLVRASNNHFGIKCKGDWTGPTVYHDDDARGECFRKYDDPRDSYKDHSDFLKNRPNYASLFNLDPTDYEAWAYGLKKAGYATNPKYPQILIKLIKDYNLEDYTLIALNRKAPDANDAIWASNTTANKIDSESSSSANAQPISVVEVVKRVYPSGIFKINETNVIFVSKGTAFLKIAEDNNLPLARLFDFNDMQPVDITANDQLIYLQRKRKTGVNEFHIVANRETVYDIAQSEGIRMESLLDFNFLKEGMHPQIGEKLYLHSKAPAMPKLASENNRPNNLSQNTTVFTQPTIEITSQDNYIVHVVQPKETMYAIAKKYAVAVDDVMKWNNMQNIDLKTGQQLRINKQIVNATN